jgi:ADP-ribosylglycohydrolase
MAVQAGFDTDCNGATVGSILGMRQGPAGIDSSWTDCLNDTLHTSLAGRNVVKISEIARQTTKLCKSLREA